MGQNQEACREERGSDILSGEREVLAAEVERRGASHSDQAPHFYDDGSRMEDNSRSDVQALPGGYDEHRDSNYAVVPRAGRVAIRSNSNIKEATMQPSPPSGEDRWYSQWPELQARLQRAEEEVKHVANQAQIETDRLSSQIRSLKQDNHSRKDSLRREAEKHAQTKLRLETEIRSLTEELEQEKRYRSDMEQRLERRSEKIVNLKTDLNKAEAQYSEINNLLKSRTAELRSAEVFLNNAEWFSRDELVNMVESLSSQIFEASSYMAELRFNDRPSGDLIAGNARLEDMIGSLMSSLLVAKPPQEDQLPLQLALQHYIILQCRRSLTSFCSSGEHNSFLADIHHKIRSSEEQSVAGRWRAMTFANCKQFKSPSMTDMTDNFIFVLKTCGWREDEKSSSACVRKIQMYLSSIEEAVGKLKAATMEGITSADVLPYVVAPETPFEPSQMINAYPNKDNRTESKGEPVLCTTDIGLKSLAAKRSRQEIFLKPKVVLISVFKPSRTEVPT